MSIATFIPTTAALCSVLLAFRYGWFLSPSTLARCSAAILLALYFVLIGREGQHVPAEVAVQRLRSGGGRPLLVGDGIVLFLEGIVTVDNLALPKAPAARDSVVSFPPSPYRLSYPSLTVV